jgi:polyketide synthase Type III
MTRSAGVTVDDYHRSAGSGLLTTLPPRIVGTGTAVPAMSYSQHEILDRHGIADSRIRSVFTNGAIERRSLILPPLDTSGRPVPESQGELLQKHKTAGTALGREAVVKCLDNAGAALPDVRYLCCVTSTGFLTPGFSALLIRELDLDPRCTRLDVVGMGCNAGLNALSATTAWAATHPGDLALLVCIEVCSAAYVFDGTMRTAVVNSLFGDGAAAVALRRPAAQAGAAAGALTSDTTGPAVLGFSSLIVPEAIDAMGYEWDDGHGKFSFYLDPDIPYLVGAHAERAVRGLLGSTKTRRSDISHWIVHPGGKKVIDAVRVNLGLTRHDVRHTMGVLRTQGNISSASFLFSLNRLIAEKCTAPGELGVLMTMGPGTTIETALVHW